MKNLSELSADIREAGQYEEFYQKGDQHGNGQNSYMQEYWKRRRLELEKEIRERRENGEKENS